MTAEIFVRPLDSYVAKQCPVRLQISREEPQIRQADEDSALMLLLQEEGNAFEVQVFSALLNLHGDSCFHVAKDLPHKEKIERTLEALSSPAGIILGGRLPVDLEGFRTSEPDVLVRFEDGWVPVDVKSHKSRSEADMNPEKYVLRVSAFDDFTPSRARSEIGWRFGHSHAKADALQLAHYRRHLEALGLASNSTLGGLIGKESEIAWIDLASDARFEGEDGSKGWAALDLYDFSFSQRLQVARDQERRNRGEDAPPPLPALRRSDCNECKWRSSCSEDREQRDCISLLPGSGFNVRVYENLRSAGYATRKSLLDLDVRTAQVLYRSGEPSRNTAIQGLIADGKCHELAALPEGIRIDDKDLALGGSKTGFKALRERLLDSGIEFTNQLRDLDPRVLSLAGKKCRNVGRLIDEARAATAGTPFLNRGLERTEVPRADVEVDVDMESHNDSTYLWGTYTTLRKPVDGIQEGYRAFVKFEDINEEAEIAIFEEFWTYLRSLRQQCQELNLTFAAYTYTTAEDKQVSRVFRSSLHDPAIAEEWDAFTKSGDWIDMKKVVTDNLVLGHGAGLKKVAPLASFKWRAEDAGGDNSIVWFQKVVSEPDIPESEALRNHLLEYNEDDVKATLVLRNWLETTRFESIEKFDSHY